MKIEIPEFRRCCACMPLRCGIITFGYLNLAFSTLILSFELWMAVEYNPDYTMVESMQLSSVSIYRGVPLFSKLWFIFILYSAEIIFNIVLLVGAHMKKPLLIRIYYYYGITTALAAFVSYIVIRREYNYDRGYEFHIIDFCLAFSGLVLQVYLLLLIRTELRKFDNKDQVCFVNNMCEAYVDLPLDGEGRNPL